MLNKILLSLVGILAIISGLLVAQNQIPGPVLGGAPPGLAAATSTTYLRSVGSTSAVTLFDTHPSCASRTISTASSTLMISFGSSTPTAIAGHWQAASSTVTYDGGLYGCGNWRAVSYAPVASSTITVTEFIQ